jgi:hypothetical protein
VVTNESVDVTACSSCGVQVHPLHRYCPSCGADNGLPQIGPEMSPADEVVAALEAMLGQQGMVVIVERPSTRRSRRCEAVIGVPEGFPGGDWDTFWLVLEDALVWDGYLFGAVASSGQQCVWHVVNGDIFPLGAEHAKSLLLYHDRLQPQGWKEEALAFVVDAPDLVS